MCMACDQPTNALGLNLDPCLCGAEQTQAAMRRLEADLDRRNFIGGSAAVLALFAGFGLQPTYVRAQSPGQPVLLTNLRYFDGETTSMQTGKDILVQGGRIEALPNSGQGPQDAYRIDCKGRSVIPGLIDCHVHLICPQLLPEAATLKPASGLDLSA